MVKSKGRSDNAIHFNKLRIRCCCNGCGGYDKHEHDKCPKCGCINWAPYIPDQEAINSERRKFDAANGYAERPIEDSNPEPHTKEFMESGKEKD